MTPSENRDRSRSVGRVDRALRARQLRRCHKHIQEMDECADKTTLLSSFTDTVLDQIDFLLDNTDWAAVNGEKKYEDAWLSGNRSLASQLVHIKKWHAEKKEAEGKEEQHHAATSQIARPILLPPPAGPTAPPAAHSIGPRPVAPAAAPPDSPSAAPPFPPSVVAHLPAAPAAPATHVALPAAPQAQSATPAQKRASSEPRRQETMERSEADDFPKQHHFRPSPSPSSSHPPWTPPSLRTLHLPLFVAQADRLPNATLAQRPKTWTPVVTPTATATATATAPNSSPGVHHQAAAQDWHSDLLERDLEKRARQQVDAQRRYRQVRPEFINYLEKRKAASLRDRSLERASAALDTAETKTTEQRKKIRDRRQEYQLAKRAIKKKSSRAAAADDAQLHERLAESGCRLQEAHQLLVAAVRENEAAYDAYAAAAEASQAAVAVEEEAFTVWEKTRLAMLRAAQEG